MRALGLYTCLLAASGTGVDTAAISAEPVSAGKLESVELARSGVALSTSAARNAGLECVVDRGTGEGIGPLGIPIPPARISVLRGYDGPARQREWRSRLTHTQLGYVDECCSRPEHFSSVLCHGPVVDTPLVLAFRGEPISYVRDGKLFRFSGADGAWTDWPTATTPWLAIDRDGSGEIESGAELFGSGTALPGGELAANGFEALAELDANHDGRVDAADPDFGALLVWSDQNGDRRTQPGELVRAGTLLESIEVHYDVVVRCDARENCERERASFTWRNHDGKPEIGAVVDVHLPRR